MQAWRADIKTNMVLVNKILFTLFQQRNQIRLGWLERQRKYVRDNRE